MSGFTRALPFVLSVEGGLSDHKDDPGGLTNYGVTQDTYNRWLDAAGQYPRSVDKITRAEVEQIYHTLYWVAGKCDGLPWPLSLVHFDSMVQHGKAPELLQRALGVKEDGKIGPQTLAAASQDDPKKHAADLIWVRLEYYTTLRNWKTFGKGWVLRMAALRKMAV